MDQLSGGLNGRPHGDLTHNVGKEFPLFIKFNGHGLSLSFMPNAIIELD